MKSKNDKTDHVSRKQFLRTVGSVVAGGSIVGVSAALLHRNMVRQTPEPASSHSGNTSPVSPYKQIASLSVPDGVESFDLTDDRLMVAAASHIHIYDLSGQPVHRFAVSGTVRDMAVNNGLIYLLFPTRIEVYTVDGEPVRSWEACSEQSDYCSLAVASGSVFVSDAAHKNLCKYTIEGNFVKVINSPNGFVIPSYSFGITCTDGIVHCSNAGRHQVEQYTLDGEYIGAFGTPGAVAGKFGGCCNPVYLTHTPAGEIITSEKGNPRISCYTSDGQFRGILLDARTLGGGNKACDIRIKGDQIWVAGQNTISTFRYDKALAGATACFGCKVDCPLKEGISI